MDLRLCSTKTRGPDPQTIDSDGWTIFDSGRPEIHVFCRKEGGPSSVDCRGITSFSHLDTFRPSVSLYRLLRGRPQTNSHDTPRTDPNPHPVSPLLVSLTPTPEPRTFTSFYCFTPPSSFPFSPSCTPLRPASPARKWIGPAVPEGLETLRPLP